MACKHNDCGWCYSLNLDANSKHGECQGYARCAVYNQETAQSLMGEPLLMNQPGDMFDVVEPSVSPIPDSGKRQEFASGSVRDTDEGKIKWSLMPVELWMFDEIDYHDVFAIKNYLTTGDHIHLWNALERNVKNTKCLQSIAGRFNGGAIKYAAYNWCLGKNVRRLIDSMGRHMHECRLGRANDDSEDHFGAMLWNMCAIAWTCTHRPDLNDFKGWDYYADSGKLEQAQGE